MCIHTNIYDLSGGSNDKDITESPNKGLFALSAISGNPEKQKEQQIEKEPASLKKNPSTFGIFGMASTEAPTTPTTTEAPDSAKVNDNAGDNATTQMMDAIFGGVKGQPRDNLGRFARKATNAPSSSSGGQKRPLESTETTDTQEESKRLALESAPSALEKTLDNDTPVSVDADTFRHYTNQELENKQLKKRIKSLTEENARWDALGRATGTRDIEGAKHIIEKATDDYAQSEMSKIKTAMNYLGELAKRIEAPEWKAHVETTEKRMGDLANNKQEILSENYSQNSQPIVSAVVAASYDIQRQVGNANAEASEWKIKYEEERAARIRMEEHLNVLERGNRSATSSWSVHASRDSATSASSPSSSTSGLGLPASSSGTSASSSLFSKPASNMGSASYTTSDIFTSSSSHPLYSASSSSSVGSSTYAPSTKNAPDLSEKKVHFEESPRGGVDSGMVHQENVHHTAVQFSSPMEAIGSTIHPHFAEAMSLTKQRRAHIYGNHRESISAGNVQKENAKQLRSADVLPEDMSDWGKVFGRTNIRQPMYGNVVFT